MRSHTHVCIYLQYIHKSMQNDILYRASLNSFFLLKKQNWSIRSPMPLFADISIDNIIVAVFFCYGFPIRVYNWLIILTHLPIATDVFFLSKIYIWLLLIFSKLNDIVTSSRLLTRFFMNYILVYRMYIHMVSTYMRVEAQIKQCPI